MHAGELLVVCGPSGGGKSTLLRLLQGIVPQRTGGDLAGEVTVLDRDATATPPYALAAAGATIVYQNPLEGFVADRVEDEVAFGPESLGLSPVEIAARVADALADARMAALRGRALGTLSGGEQQRVALAAALALRPRLLLLDEPTAHLDEATAIDVLALVERIRRERGMAVVLAEHRLGVAAPLADRVAIVVDGALRAAGRPRTVLADPVLPLLGVPVPRAAQAAVRLGLVGDLPLTSTELAARMGPVDRAILSAGPRPVTSEAAVRLEGAGFRYPQASGDALSDVTLAIGRGERVAIVGPSGAGKSTLTRIATGLRHPTAGHVEILGLRDPALAAVAGRVGLLVQNPLRQLLADTVEREIAIGLRGLEARAARTRVDDLLERFDLVGVRGRHPLLLSEGQRRRVTLAAVLARRPELLVMDEPTLAQDEAQRAALAELLRDLASTGTAILAVTHDREFANDACDRAVVLRAGRIVADLQLGGDAASARALASAGVPLADVPATVLALDARGDRIAARSVDDLVAAVR